LTRFDLLGQSFGALISVRAIVARPASARRLVLAGPATIPSSWAAPGIFARWLGMSAMLRVCPARLRPTVARVVRRAGGFARDPAPPPSASSPDPDRPATCPLPPARARER